MRRRFGAVPVGDAEIDGSFAWTDEDAKVLRMRRGGVEVVADFRAKQVHIRR